MTSPSRPHRRWRPAAPPLLLALWLAGCSFSLGGTPEGVAADLIEGDLAGQLGLGEITADCDAPASRDPGTTFVCTSQSPYGQIEWLATMADESTVNIESANLVAPRDLVVLEEAAVSALEDQYGTALGTENFDCGEEPVVLTSELSIVCTLIDPENPDLVYDTTLTFTDMEAGTFDIKVADVPRN